MQTTPNIYRLSAGIGLFVLAGSAILFTAFHGSRELTWPPMTTFIVSVLLLSIEAYGRFRVNKQPGSYDKTIGLEYPREDSNL